MMNDSVCIMFFMDWSIICYYIIPMDSFYSILYDEKNSITLWKI